MFTHHLRHPTNDEAHWQSGHQFTEGYLVSRGGVEDDGIIQVGGSQRLPFAGGPGDPPDQESLVSTSSDATATEDSDHGEIAPDKADAK